MKPLILSPGILTLVTTTSALPAFVGPPTPYDHMAIGNSARSISKRVTGGVSVCSGTNLKGNCWSGAWPLDECIALNDYSGHVLSFQPDAGNECFLMQGRCDANEDYADLSSNSTGNADLSIYPWIGNARSYICMTPISFKGKRRGASEER